MNNEKCKVCGGKGRHEVENPENGNVEEWPCTACAPTARDAGTIDTQEFWKLANAWGCASQFKPRTELAVALVAHIDKHVAAAVAPVREAYMNQTCRLLDAEAELAKLRAVLKALPDTNIAEQPEWGTCGTNGDMWKAYLARVVDEALAAPTAQPTPDASIDGQLTGTPSAVKQEAAQPTLPDDERAMGG